MQEPGAYEICGDDNEGYDGEEGATPADDLEEHEDDCEESSSEEDYEYEQDDELELDRKYGFFRCDTCNKQWESSHVYCRAGTYKVAYKQECRKCKTGEFPYQVEDIICSMCGSTECDCDRSERHVDARKPHRDDLCLKCRAGNPCVNSVMYEIQSLSL